VKFGWCQFVTHSVRISDHIIFSTGRFNVYEHRLEPNLWDYEKEGSELETFAKSQINLEPTVVRKNYLIRIKQSFDKLLEKLILLVVYPFKERFRYQLQAQSRCRLLDWLVVLQTKVWTTFYFHNREASAKYFLLDQGLLDDYDGDALMKFIKPC